MVESGLALSPAKYYEEAKIMLGKRDMVEFVSNISSAIVLTGNNKEMLAKATYLRSIGLMEFNQHTKAVDSIDEALKYNTGVDVLELKKLKGTAKGFLGCVSEAIRIYQELLKETTEKIAVVRICINLAWVYTTLDRENHHKGGLDEAKKYLDMAMQYFDILPDLLKRKVLNNYSVYHFYQGEYEKAINVLNEALKYAEERDLPKLYNNLAEVYLKYSEEKDFHSSLILEYLDKSEIIAAKFDDNIELAFSLYARAKLEIQEEQIFSALDTLYLAFDHFIDSEAYSYSLEVLLKINQLVSESKAKCIKTMQEKLHNKVRNNLYYEKNEKVRGIL